MTLKENFITGYVGVAGYNGMGINWAKGAFPGRISQLFANLLELMNKGQNKKAEKYPG